jgi:structure-specific recognition protein 1
MASLRPSRKAKNKDIRYDSDAKGSGSEGEEERDDSEEERPKEKSRKRKKDAPKPSKPAKRAKEDTGRKKKAKKDPNAPKKPLSAYMLWLQENRPMIKQEIPGASLGDIGKRAGEMWKALDDKSEWEAKAKQARKKYDGVMQEYKAKQSSSPSK